ncbi:hypothetical protein FJZ31_37550 [Candidatus Poribacteria bacterium]|nr:hypothetical protein [Candidatus Poribacteria bacterium]
MKKFLVFATLFILCLVLGFSALATNVCGPIEKDTTWRKADSPYIVTCDVIVVKDITLTIEPGVTVKFDKDKALLIDGKLVAQGTPSEKIIFTANGTGAPGYWGYISFSDTSKDATFDSDGNYTGGCILQYADIQYGGSGKSAVTITLSSPFIADSFIALNSGGGIKIDKGSPVIRNCEIKNHNNSGISYSGDASSNPTVQKCIISENFAGNGGGLYLASGAFKIQNSTISGNFASSNGGAIYLASGSLTVESSTIINRNIASGGSGGGICASGTLIVQNSTISENTAGVYGGGIYLGSGSLTVESSTINKNLASGNGYGGGIFASGTVAVQNSTISENTAGNYYGGGIYVSGSLTVQNSTIIGNFASGNGGGIYLASGSLTVESSTISRNIANYYAYGGGICASGTLMVQNSTISENTAGNYYGGGIYVSGILNAEGSTFTDNSAGYIGGAIFASGTVVIKNNKFNKECQGPGNNTAPYGGAIYASGAITMRGNTIIGNTASTQSGGIVRLDKAAGVIGGSPTDANHIENNAGDAVWISGNPAFNYNDVYGNYNEVYKTGYELINGSNSPIDATNCYWGTTDEAKIEAEIYHKPDNPSLGLVTYKPFSPTPFFDTIPPAAVIDLTASSPTATSITLTWTAPGDDGNVGTAAQYDILLDCDRIAN